MFNSWNEILEKVHARGDEGNFTPLLLVDYALVGNSPDEIYIQDYGLNTFHSIDGEWKETLVELLNPHGVQVIKITA